METATSPASARPKTPTRLRSRKRFLTRVGDWLLGLNAVAVFGFIYLPVLILIIFSFNDTRSVAVLTGFSTQWYTKLASNVELLDAARNSLIVALITTIVATVIGTMTALAMDRHRFRGRTTYDANLYLPIVIPEIVMGIALLLFFNQALFPFLLDNFGLRATTGLPTITIAHIAFDIPFVYVIVRARLADFDRGLEEAAQDLGANEWHTFGRVTLPLILPGIIGGALLAFTLSLDDYLITAFTKGTLEQTMPLYIYSLVRRGVTPEINALSTVLLLGSIGLVALSLTAQSGGALYTRAMAVGASLALGAYGLISLPAFVLSGGITIGGLLLHLALLAAFYWTYGALKGYSEEFVSANNSGRALSGFAALVIFGAVFVSAFLLAS